MTTLRFTALDTWFFREARPMESLGGAELASVFPPPPRTLMGAVRTAIGDTLGGDWHNYATDTAHPYRPHIGTPTDFGPLELTGPWLTWEEERLYPVPRCLLANARQVLTRLEIGPAEETSLGRVCLPRLPRGQIGLGPLENAWITGVGLKSILAGGLPAPSTILTAANLFQEEPRLGIARNHDRRTAADGLLYQTCHLRPKAGLGVEIDLEHAADSPLPAGLLRLGGEGRLAHCQLAARVFPGKPSVTDAGKGLLLVLLTPALLSGPEAWLPQGFQPDEQNGVRIWKGKINGVPLTLHAAALGKAQREGGWDTANRRPRPVQSLVPAGSCYYCTCTGDRHAAIDALHDAHIGLDQNLGRGHLACGLWNDTP